MLYHATASLISPKTGKPYTSINLNFPEFETSVFEAKDDIEANRIASKCMKSEINKVLKRLEKDSKTDDWAKEQVTNYKTFKPELTVKALTKSQANKFMDGYDYLTSVIRRETGINVHGWHMDGGPNKSHIKALLAYIVDLKKKHNIK